MKIPLTKFNEIIIHNDASIPCANNLFKIKIKES